MLAADQNPLKGIVLKLASVMAFMAMSALIKAAGQVPAGEITFFRSFFAVFPILAYLAFTGTLRSAFVTHDLFGQIWRALVGVSAMTCFFYAITRLPLPEVTALGFASPLFVVVLSALFLGETVRIYRWTAVVGGLVGVTIIAWPRFTAFDGNLGGEATLGAFATLAGAFLAALAMLFVRRLVKTETTQTIVLYFSLIAALAALASLPFGWIMPTPQQAALLIAAGCCGGIAQIMMTEGYRHAEASLLAPFEYASMLFAIIIGYVAFDEVPSAYTLAGGLIVVAAGIFIIWRERQLGLKRGPIKAVATPQD
ncbi:MAG: DMT family transporter [Phyllobacteriaceae bacterium]|nr:DMT family transporter [Phyllobacteriaceae bacterium]